MKAGVIFVFGIFLPLLLISCQSILEQQRQELILEACEAGVFIPPDLFPAPYVKESFAGVTPAVSGNMTDIFADAVVDDVYVSRVLSGRLSEGAYDYRPIDGTRIIIENVLVEPQRVHPGGYLNLIIRYVLLSPVHSNWTPISEFRDLYYNEQLVGRPEAHLSLPDGTYTTAVRVRLPMNAPVGEYEFLARVQTHHALDAKKASFYVVTSH